MAKLKCKNCEKLFELNGIEDINCPYCGVKLKNSYTEWIKKPGHENKTFDDYKKKKCILKTRFILDQSTSPEHDGCGFQVVSRDGEPSGIQQRPER